MSLRRQTQIKADLDELYRSYHAEYHSSPSNFFETRRDPLLFPHRYKTFHDIEAAAFIAATFAYGNVTSLCAFVEKLLGMMGSSPHAFLMDGKAIDRLESKKPYYRLQKAPQIAGFLRALSRVYTEHGSLYAILLKSYNKNNTMKVAISDFVGSLGSISGEELRFLVPSPTAGSPCKRLMLFFRWMVRRDGIDFGLWEKIPTSALIMPMDTHIGRTAYRLGWIQTQTLTWQKAEEVTAVLRSFDPDDPTRYDFSLCHESMSKSRFLSRLCG